MLKDIIAYLRCTHCAGTDLLNESGGIVCSSCGFQYPFREGIQDMTDERRRETITPFQRLMQAPAIVSIYESRWRRLGYYLASSRSFDEEIRTVIRLEQKIHARSILDLACGPGVFTRPLARTADRIVVGFDLSMPMLRRAKKLVEDEKISNVVLIRGTALRMPFRDNIFPYVNCCGALHLFDNPDTVLSEIYRILGPEGFLCVQTTIRPERSAGMAYILEKFIRFGFFEESELRDKLRIHGFRLLESERHRISYTFLAQKIEGNTRE
jgi:ubiquinone/menaquinone biosynthesis C-methylase UbiE